MVFSACIEWFNDWTRDSPPFLRDEWDFTQWMTGEMCEATECFLTYAFTSSRARNDAIQILRAIYYEYFLFEQGRHVLVPNPDAVARLLALPQTAQKSASWHSEARELLTAHEFGAVCYGTPARSGLVVAKKCVAEVVAADVDADAAAMHSQHVFMCNEDGGLSALKWGWRYEPVARALFEQCVAGGPVDDTLGRIRHHTLPRLAASPDGLITSGPRSGRLVEIKCPISRELTGVIPIDYYCQMQLQAEVCDVDAVEYVEARLALLKSPEELSAVVATCPWIGKVCVTTIDALSDDYNYEYSPVFPATLEGFAQAAAWHPISEYIHESSMWYVKDWFTKTVIRNRDWWAAVGFPAYEEFWREVEAARLDGRFKPRSQFVDSDSDSSEGVQVYPETIAKWEGID